MVRMAVFSIEAIFYSSNLTVLEWPAEKHGIANGKCFCAQFSSMDGLDSMLENGLWFIRNNPLILKKWNPDVNLLKEDVGNVPVWVKLHGVPVTAFSEDGLSAIATKLGTPLMLDSYTSDMCMQS
ncbi:putative reverse transcriptase domain-containing protein, partial [Tanacetum coccineum]